MGGSVQVANFTSSAPSLSTDRCVTIPLRYIQNRLIIRAVFALWPRCPRLTSPGGHESPRRDLSASDLLSPVRDRNRVMPVLARAPETQTSSDLEHLQGAWISVAGPCEARLLIVGNRYTFEFLGGDIYMGTTRPRPRRHGHADRGRAAGAPGKDRPVPVSGWKVACFGGVRAARDRAAGRRRSRSSTTRDTCPSCSDRRGGTSAPSMRCTRLSPVRVEPGAARCPSSYSVTAVFSPSRKEWES